MYYIVLVQQALGSVVTCLKSSINMSRALTSAARTMQVDRENKWRGIAVGGVGRSGGGDGGCKQWETDSPSCFSCSIVSFPTWPGPWRAACVNVWTGRQSRNDFEPWIPLVLKRSADYISKEVQCCSKSQTSLWSFRISLPNHHSRPLQTLWQSGVIISCILVSNLTCFCSRSVKHFLCFWSLLQHIKGYFLT